MQFHPPVSFPQKYKANYIKLILYANSGFLTRPEKTVLNAFQMKMQRKISKYEKTDVPTE